MNHRRAPALKPHVRAVAAEAASRIRDEVLGLRATPADLESVLAALIDHFVDRLDNADLGDGRVLDLVHQLGERVAREGSTLPPWHTAIRLAAGIAIRRLAEVSAGCDVAQVGQVAAEVFAYTERIDEALAGGYAAAGGLEINERRSLFDLLVNGSGSLAAISEQARRAQWPLPRTVAAIALHPRDSATARRPALPPEALLVLDHEPPCVIIPDPEGPGRRHLLETAFHDQIAAIGPAVPLAETALSLRWAALALDLARTGLIDSDKPIAVTDHMPLLVMAQDEKLLQRVAASRLAPLADLRPQLRDDLVETLLILIEHRFNATAVASRLLIHPQTVRYRLRKLEELLGPALYEPEHQLELHMVLAFTQAMRRSRACAPDRGAPGVSSWGEVR